MTDRSSDRSPTEPAPSSAPVSEPNWFERFLSAFGLRGVSSIREGLADALALSTPTTEFSAQERAMLQNVLKLRGLRVDDVMVPRADIVAVPIDTTLGALMRTFRTAGHSRLPVYGETLDDPRGMVHIRDFLDFLVACAEAGASGGRRRRKKETGDVPSLAGVDLNVTLASAKILRPVLYAPPSMPAVDLLARMQATRTHMALVIDEYGGTDGLASIEDLVEMIVGNIEDEHDDEDTPMIVANGTGFVADARAGLEEVTSVIGVDLNAGELAEDVDTLGGLVVTVAGRVPVRGELIPFRDDLEFEVLDADARRLKRVRIHVRGSEAAREETKLLAPPAPSSRAGDAAS